MCHGAVLTFYTVFLSVFRHHCEAPLCVSARTHNRERVSKKNCETFMPCNDIKEMLENFYTPAFALACRQHNQLLSADAANHKVALNNRANCDDDTSTCLMHSVVVASQLCVWQSKKRGKVKSLTMAKIMKFSSFLSSSSCVSFPPSLTQLSSSSDSVWYFSKLYYAFHAL